LENLELWNQNWIKVTTFLQRFYAKYEKRIHHILASEKIFGKMFNWP